MKLAPMALVALSLLVGCSGVERQQLVVSTEQANGETRVTCVLPQVIFDDNFDKTHFVVQEIIVRDISGNPLPASHKGRHPTVSFVAPDHRLAEITLDVLYIDARALEEATGGQNLRDSMAVESPDWQVRFRQFKLSDALKNGAIVVRDRSSVHL